MNAFKKALLDTVLAEYEDTASLAEATADDVRHHSVWVDREHLLLYTTRHDGCIQHLFLSQEHMDTFLQHLQAQGFTKK